MLKARFGSWPFLFALNLIFSIEVVIHFMTGGRWDPGLLLLNLFLSWLAAQQGGALQISANRQDKINAEQALRDAELTQRTAENTDAIRSVSSNILTLQKQQMTMLDEIRAVRGELKAAQEQSESDG